MLCSGGGATTLGRSLKNEAEVASSLKKRWAGLAEGLRTRAVLRLRGGGAPREAGEPRVKLGLRLTVGVPSCMLYWLLGLKYQ